MRLFYKVCILTERSRESVMSLVTRLRAGTSGARIPLEQEHFLFPKVQINSGVSQPLIQRVPVFLPVDK
jgi:hypothetical protein